MFIRTLLVSLISACAMLPVLSAAEPTSSADAILGKWWFPKRDGQLEVRCENDAYFGKVIAYDKPGQVDEHNPDPKLRDRPFVGIEMLADFKYDPNDQKWVEGTIYDGESGKTYKCTMWFENNNQDRLNVRGYIGFSFLGRTEIFERVRPEDEQSAEKADGESAKS